MNAAALPVPPGTHDETCLIHSLAEIVPLLRDVVAKHALLTIHFGDSPGFIVTNMLAVDPVALELVFDCGADATMNRRLLAAPRLTFVTFLDHIKIQFATASARETLHDGAPAFRTRLPESVLRLQRRNFYRVKVPLSRPVLCRLSLPGTPRATLDLKVLDLSLGGLALLVCPDDFDALPGDAIGDCRITIPDFCDFRVALEVRNTEMLAEDDKHRLKRIGCRFVNLPGMYAGVIQRYILKMERNRLGVR